MYIDAKNTHILSNLVGQVFMINDYGLFIAVNVLFGAVLGGLGGLGGSLVAPKNK
jgi:hypothetical protein